MSKTNIIVYCTTIYFSQQFTVLLALSEQTTQEWIGQRLTIFEQGFARFIQKDIGTREAKGEAILPRLLYIAPQDGGCFIGGFFSLQLVNGQEIIFASRLFVFMNTELQGFIDEFHDALLCYP